MNTELYISKIEVIYPMSLGAFIIAVFAVSLLSALLMWGYSEYKTNGQMTKIKEIGFVIAFVFLGILMSHYVYKVTRPITAKIGDTYTTVTQKQAKRIEDYPKKQTQKITESELETLINKTQELPEEQNRFENK